MWRVGIVYALSIPTFCILWALFAVNRPKTRAELEHERQERIHRNQARYHKKVGRDRKERQYHAFWKSLGIGR
jgi:hypothetical protein